MVTGPPQCRRRASPALLLFQTGMLCLAMVLRPTLAHADANHMPSLLDSMPGLAYFANHSPIVFGLPADLAEGKEVTGDWGGARTDMVAKGLLVDAYSTTLYQGVTSGGLSDVGAFTQSTDVAVNFDTGRLGWWSNGLLHALVMSRTGSELARFAAPGALVPTSMTYVYPTVLQANATYLNELYLYQKLTQEHALIAGKFNSLFVADQNTWAGNYRYQFTNASLCTNPIVAVYFQPVTWLAADVWYPNNRLRITSGVSDPLSDPSSLFHNLFREVNFFQEYAYSYTRGSLPGGLRAGWVYSTLHQTALPTVAHADLFSLDSSPATKMGISGLVFANFEQYLRVADSPEVLQEKVRTAQPVRGYGLFGRLGLAPPNTNIIDAFGSLGVGAYGVSARRPNDFCGVGWYYCFISHVFESRLQQQGVKNEGVSDEQGVEVFYNFALTPSVQFTPAFQYIWHPLAADLGGIHHAALWSFRFEMAL